MQQCIAHSAACVRLRRLQIEFWCLRPRVDWYTNSRLARFQLAEHRGVGCNAPVEVRHEPPEVLPE
eukprot:7986305-Lingulodinium_polyedra.AAC.1